MEEKEIYRIREYLHQHPELSGQEVHTAAFVIQTLQKSCPTELYNPVGGQGVVAAFCFSDDGPTILFRADMDAVAIGENLEINYSSVHPGISHKCGHDGHTAILLALASQLHRHPLKRGKILLLFQPAEENGQGARAVLEDPCFKQLKTDYAFALHNLPGYPANAIVCRPGSFTCSVISCSITLTGKTSHAAEPEKAVSPTEALLNILHLAESWNHGDLTNPDYFRATLIELHIGEEAYGVTAGKGVLRLTLRATTEDKLQDHIQQLQETIKAYTRTGSGLHASVEWLEPFAANENEPQMVSLIQQTAQKNNLSYIESDHPFAWGEDFGLFTQHFPGAMFGLGAGIQTPPLHTPEYDFPNEIIEAGVRMFYSIAAEFCK